MRRFGLGAFNPYQFLLTSNIEPPEAEATPCVPCGEGAACPPGHSCIGGCCQLTSVGVPGQQVTALLADPLVGGATAMVANAGTTSTGINLTKTYLPKGGGDLPGASTPAATVKADAAADDEEIARLKEELARVKSEKAATPPEDYNAQLRAMMEQIAALKAQSAQKKQMAEGLETPGEKLQGALAWAALPGLAAGGAYAMKKPKVAMGLGVLAIAAGIFRYVRTPAHLSEET